MSEPSTLLIEEIFYPTQEVRSLNNHSAQGERAGTLLKFGRQVQKLENQPGKYALAVSVGSDDEKSRNPPYHFVIEVYAIVTIGGTPLEGEAAEKFILTNGLPLLMGAIRERLADITARAPWGRFLINALPLQESVQLNIM
ncbi:MAG: hypothetical protein QM696_10590 [Steroidobacteraceae bacterium]